MDLDAATRPVPLGGDFDPPYLPGDESADAGHSSSLAAGTLASYLGILATGGNRWNASAPQGTSVSLTYAFRNAAPSSYPTVSEGDVTGTFAALSTAARAEVRTLLAYVGSAVGISFTEVADSSSATIQIGSFTFTDGHSGFAYYPGGTPSSPQGQAGDIWLDRSQTSSVGPGSFFDQLFLHELGHALGLKHPFDGTTNQQLVSTLDRAQYTVMTYQNYGDLTQNLVPTWTGTNVTTAWLYRSTYAPLDLQALRALYGTGPSSTNSGDNTYRFTTAAVMTTISDRGGHDVIDASSLNLASVIDLRPGTSSSIGLRSELDWLDILATQGMPNSARSSIHSFLLQHETELYTGAGNLAIDLDTIVEDAIGGGGSDTLRGNSANNRLTGNGGNDTIDGDDGIDTAVYTLNFSNYTVARNGTDFTVTAKTGSEGTDALHAVERLQFKDGVVLLDQGSNGAAAFRLYQAAFARSPDEAGLKVQIHALDTGTSLLQLARNFIGSGEFQSKYGVAVDNSGYATALYRNVLGRDPDAGGLKVQVDALNAGLAREQLLVNFSESAENLNLTSAKTAVGLFVTYWDASYG